LGAASNSWLAVISGIIALISAGFGLFTSLREYAKTKRRVSEAGHRDQQLRTTASTQVIVPAVFLRKPGLSEDFERALYKQALAIDGIKYEHSPD
jgi:hypothetical protein